MKDWLSKRSASEIAVLVCALLVPIALIGWYCSTQNEKNLLTLPVATDEDYIDVYLHADDYMGQTVRIGGRVSDVMRDDLKNNVIVFSDRFNNIFQNIYVILDENQKPTVKAGDFAVIEGRVSAKSGGMLNIVDSTIVATGDEAKDFAERINSYNP